MKWSDKIEALVTSEDGLSHQRQAVTMDELFHSVNEDIYSIRDVRIRQALDLSTAGGKYVTAVHMLSGWLLKYAGLQILSNITMSGTSVKLGLGQQDSTPSGYGLTPDLNKNSYISKIINTILDSDTDLDISAVVTDGSALGSGNISGLVVVSFIISQPTTFPPVQ